MSSKPSAQGTFNNHDEFSFGGEYGRFCRRIAKMASNGPHLMVFISYGIPSSWRYADPSDLLSNKENKGKKIGSHFYN